MPTNSSHLLQPLDIGCFSALKRAYGQLVENQARLGISHIDKLDFLAAYLQARVSEYKAETIHNSFAAAGLVPIQPDRVLAKLNIQLNTPTAPEAAIHLTNTENHQTIRSASIVNQNTIKAPLAQLTKSA